MFLFPCAYAHLYKNIKHMSNEGYDNFLKIHVIIMCCLKIGTYIFLSIAKSKIIISTHVITRFQWIFVTERETERNIENGKIDS